MQATHDLPSRDCENNVEMRREVKSAGSHSPRIDSQSVGRSASALAVTLATIGSHSLRDRWASNPLLAWKLLWWKRAAVRGFHTTRRGKISHVHGNGEVVVPQTESCSLMFKDAQQHNNQCTESCFRKIGHYRELLLKRQCKLHTNTVGKIR